MSENCRDAEIGRQTGLRIQGPQGCAGSIPVPGTDKVQTCPAISGILSSAQVPPRRDARKGVEVRSLSWAHKE